jgi:PAS domain S-box-containing protein
MSGERVLIVEDDAILAEHLADILTGYGYRVDPPLATGEEAVREAQLNPPDIILMDIRLLGEMTGIVAAQQIQKIRDIPVIYLTAFSDPELLRQAIGTEPYGYLVKPVQGSEVRTTIEVALYKHRLDRKVKASERKYRTLAEAIPDPVFIIDHDDTILYVNTSAAESLQLPADEITGKPRKSLFPPDIADEQSHDLQTVFESEKPLRKETEILYGDREIWQDNTLVPLKDETGNVTAVLGISRDITDRKRAEEALVESEIKYRNLAETIQDCIITTDLDGIITYANPVARNLVGERGLVGVALKDFVDQEQVTWHREMLNARRQGVSETLSFEWHITSPKDGSSLIFDVRASILIIDKGSPSGVLFNARDVTERKRAEEALLASDEKIRLLLNSTAEAIYGLDMNGNCTFCNNSGLRQLGYNHPDELLGRNMHWQIHAKHPDGTHFPVEECRIFQAFHKGESTHVDDEVLWRSDGTSFPAEYWSYPQRRDGVVVGAVVTFLDITRQKEIETQLKNYQNTLEQRVHDRTIELSATNLKLKKEIEDRIKIQKNLTISATEKDLLLREVNHRVKNNLQLIIGLVDMTKTRAHEPAVRSTLTNIMTKVQTIGLIHSQLYESKRFDKVSMKRQVQDLVDMIAGFYDHERHDITTNINCPDIFLPVDLAIPCALALNEIISNIYKHAFKGKRNGLVEISLSVKGDQLRIAVRDNGVGLPTGFDIEKSNRLGLKLMRTLVEQQLRGSVTITSIAGTEVVIEFPINREE